MRRLELAALFGIVLAAAGLRLLNLGAEPFWGDEILSLDIARHFSSLRETLAYVREVEFHPPLYYLLLYYWTNWFGIGELAVRLPSVIFGTGSVVVMYFFANRIFQSQKAALLAAAVLAVLPFHVEFSQEARPYIMYCFFGLAAAFAAWEYRQSRKMFIAAVYAVSSLVGLYLHYSYFLWFAALALWWLWDMRRDFQGRDLVNFLVIHAVIALGFAWWLPALLYKLLLGRYEIFGLARSVADERPPDFFERITTNMIWLNKEYIRLGVSKLAVLLTALLKILLIAAAAWVFRRLNTVERRPFYLLGFLTVIPFAGFLLAPYSTAYAPLYFRHVIFLTVPLALILSAVGARLPGKKALALMSLFFVSLVPAIAETASNDALWDPDFKVKEISEQVNALYEPGDVVLVSYAFFRSDAAFYLKAEIPVFAFLPLGYHDLDIWNSRQTLGLIENEYQSRVPGEHVPASDIAERLETLIEAHNARRVWLVAFERNYLGQGVQDWFTANNWRHGFRSISNIFRLDLYARR